MSKRTIRPIFGLEFEVAMAAVDAHGHRISPGIVLNAFMHSAMKRIVHLPAHGASGIFLENGSRLYLDCGKPEITTPEVVTPADACRYSRASESLLVDICDDLVREMDPVKAIILSRNNVSYGGNCNTWACHESYGHRIRSANIADHFIPHAVSRIVYTGAGGFDNRSHAVRFLISPRVAHLDTAVSESTQRNRGIFNTKDESLSGHGFNRLHVICGENVSSLRAQWLKIGTTAIVVAMIEAGMAPCDGLGLTDPVAAMRAFAADVSLKATAPTVAGEQLTAIEIQRRILARAKDLSAKGTFQEWLPDCCRLWEETLDRLEREGAAGVGRTLDWAIKWGLFQQYAERRGMPWERLLRWNRVLMLLDGSFSLPSPEGLGLSLFAKPGPLAALLRQHWPRAVAEQGLDWAELDHYLKLRQELFELDVRFAQLDDRGIFNTLDRAGHLDHHAPGVEEIARAKTEPPAEGRAGLRGAVIKRLAGRAGSVVCEWRGVWDFRDRKHLDLSDPFAREEMWTAMPEESEVPQPDYGSHVRRMYERAAAHYERGEYEVAAQMLQGAVDWVRMLGLPMQRDVDRLMAWIQARRGFLDADERMAEVHGREPAELPAICDYLHMYRFHGFAPRPAMIACLDKGLRLHGQHGPTGPSDTASLMGHHAYRLLWEGSLEEAVAAYDEALHGDRVPFLHGRYHARLLTEKAEALRRLNRCDETSALLAQARRIQTAGRYHGDAVDLTKPQEAKVAVHEHRCAEAAALLAAATDRQAGAGSAVARTRNRLLMVRIGHIDQQSQRLAAPCDDIRRQVIACRDQRTALAQCPLLAKILDHWDQWIDGEMLDDETDFFWRL